MIASAYATQHAYPTSAKNQGVAHLPTRIVTRIEQVAPEAHMASAYEIR
ncbi:hypothetical protein LWC34_47340 [Kibdelosporangium philippinense]|uniref:Uncharacterized protein n=1 Tax=Kibdelosporangium philippinense TaxID=211113 RepID=A0ABS8ZRN7_9PSEU|nr:hypothetical protein [Kibdelosporangium philippinense]MCE7010370.1 hypothetical protein [Kibdelosporangium philippinense]